MKRIAIIGKIITAFAVAPSVGVAGNASAQQKPQVVPKASPKALPGGQLWRAGNHLMY